MPLCLGQLGAGLPCFYNEGRSSPDVGAGLLHEWDHTIVSGPTLGSDGGHYISTLTVVELGVRIIGKDRLPPGGHVLAVAARCE